MIQSPYLIQRGKALEFNKDILTGDYIKLDYMGAAEFEFGAFPKYQRAMNDKLKSLHIFLVEHGGMNLFFVSTHEQAAEYSQMLKDLIDNKVRSLKMSARLTSKQTIYVGKKQTPVFDAPHAPYEFDVWFDLTNQLFFARTEAAVKNLFVTIPNSVRYMDAMRKKA